MEITNPKRILAVSLNTDSHHLSRVITDLTGTTPIPINDNIAGITHDLRLKTAYYTATIPIWLDLTSSPSEWSATFLSEEAKEVLAALGGIVVVFRVGESPDRVTGELVRAVGKVVEEGLGGWEWDGVSLAVAVGEERGEGEKWDELCAEVGLEFVVVQGKEKDKGINEFGEKKGVYRALEALQANNWDIGALDREEEEDDVFDFDVDNMDFAMGDPADFEGLRQAIWCEITARESSAKDLPSPTPGQKSTTTITESSTDAQRETKDGHGGIKKKMIKITPSFLLPKEEALLESDEVERLEKLMGRLKTTREIAEGLPEAERKRVAKKVVIEVMKELE